MDKLITLFPQQLTDALKLGQSFTFSQPKKNLENIVISGLGGSGIGGTIFQNYAAPILDIPVVVNKTYDLPQFVNQNSLVIICSYSGNTEETIEALQQSIKKNATIVCITSGGKIGEMAAEYQIPRIKIPSEMPPRACLGYSLIQILVVAHAAQLIDNSFVEQIEKSILLLENNKEKIQDMAQNLAQKITDKLPVIYAASQMEGVAIRWRQQLNENSKMNAWENVVPEMNHNELVGWHDVNENLAVIFLRSASDHSKVKIRMDINKVIVEKCTQNVFEIEAFGESYWEQVFSLIHTGDWLSLYLSKLRKVDALEVSVIDYLKNKLAVS